jgi:hypothetical protein
MISINLIICFIISITIYLSILKNIYSTCKQDVNINIKKLRGVKIIGVGESKILGLPTVNLKLEKQIPCGYYLGMTNFGAITLIVGYTDQTEAHINFHDFDDNINKQKIYEIHDLNRISHPKNSIFKTFNKGCCP